jgi:hypothetical protein
VNFKKIYKKLNSSKWGKYRYSLVKGVYRIERLSKDDGWVNTNPYGNRLPSSTEEQKVIKYIIRKRAIECWYWAQEQRKKRNYNKRKWNYIPDRKKK